MAWKHGRTWCNTICPVGTVLGLLSRFSLFKVRIDSDRCNGCGLCATKCKAACINSKEHAVDYSRCVDCFDCLGACKQKALVYNPSLKKRQSGSGKDSEAPLSPNTDSAKRRFLIAGLLTAGAAPKLLSQAKESVASLEGKKHIKGESDHSAGICQPRTFSAAMYIVPPLCQQMPVTCTETGFYGVWIGRNDAAYRQL